VLAVIPAILYLRYTCIKFGEPAPAGRRRARGMSERSACSACSFVCRCFFLFTFLSSSPHAPHRHPRCPTSAAELGTTGTASGTSSCTYRYTEGYSDFFFFIATSRYCSKLWSALDVRKERHCASPKQHDQRVRAACAGCSGGAEENRAGSNHGAHGRHELMVVRSVGAARGLGRERCPSDEQIQESRCGLGLAQCLRSAFLGPAVACGARVAFVSAPFPPGSLEFDSSLLLHH